MSRTNKGTKSPGFDCWTARPGNKHGISGYGKDVKKSTHKAERQMNKKDILE